VAFFEAMTGVADELLYLRGQVFWRTYRREEAVATPRREAPVNLTARDRREQGLRLAYPFGYPLPPIVHGAAYPSREGQSVHVTKSLIRFT